MKMNIFVNLNQSVEPDVAAKVCELHGFIFEREKREKGGGVHKAAEKNAGAAAAAGLSRRRTS